MAADYGVYLEGAGITDRATVIVSGDGIVRFAESVTPGGERDIDALLAECQRVQAEHPVQAVPAALDPLPTSAALYVKSNCGFSRAALLARENLHLIDGLQVKNVSDDAGARSELQKIAGKDQAPCLVIDGRPQHESAEIIARMVAARAPLAG